MKKQYMYECMKKSRNKFTFPTLRVILNNGLN